MDVEIHKSLGWELAPPESGYSWWLKDGSDFLLGPLPSYTTSLGAALTLVPEGWLWEIKRGVEARAIVWTLEKDYDETAPPTGYHAESPALALCIACLKARNISENV